MQPWQCTEKEKLKCPECDEEFMVHVRKVKAIACPKCDRTSSFYTWDKGTEQWL